MRHRYLSSLAGLLLLIPLGAVSPAKAQHALATGQAYDPRIPTPASVLGYQIGAQFTPHHLLLRYAERIATASNRVTLDTMAVTIEGREALLAVLTSPRNQQRLDTIQHDASVIANPDQYSTAEIEAASQSLPAIVWLGYTVHGNEASGTEAAIALLYQLAAGTDPTTMMILDSAVVLIDPVQNPDGHERHAQYTRRMSSATAIPTESGAMIQRGEWPGARTSHYFFDLNRDWFIHSHPETRGRIAHFLAWWPHVTVDLHEMGSNSTYFFAPPMEPVNKNVHTTIRKWWEIFAASNAAAFDANGWPFFRREGYDEFYPGYGVSWPILTGSVGMTYEQASSAGGAIRRSDGSVLTLNNAATHHYTAAWATLRTSATRARERVRDYLLFKQTALTDPPRDGVRAIAFARDVTGRADSLVRVLVGNGIRVQQLVTPHTMRATPYGGRSDQVSLPAGGYVVSYAQPQGRLARAILEPDSPLDSTFIQEELERRRTGQRDRFYDVTSWSLPFAYRLQAWELPSIPSGTETVTWPLSAPEREPPSRAQFGYAFAPGSEASLGALASLLRDSIKVWYAPNGFRVGTADFPHGAFVVRVASNDPSVHDRVSRAANATGATIVALPSARVDDGTDLGSNSVFYLRPVRIGLVGGQGISGNAFGFSWFTLDQRLRYPVMTLTLGSLRTALPQLDVVILPSAQPSALDTALGQSGRDALASWVRAGGTLITMEGATTWLADARTGLARLRVRHDSLRADSTGGAPLPASIPGSTVRATIDTLSPLLAGIWAPEIPVLVNGSSILAVPADLRAGEAIIRYAPTDRLLLSGYLWPETPERLAGAPYLWTERIGRGRVIAFAGDPNYRDIWRGLLPLFANAIFIGPSM